MSIAPAPNLWSRGLSGVISECPKIEGWKALKEGPGLISMVQNGWAAVGNEGVSWSEDFREGEGVAASEGGEKSATHIAPSGGSRPGPWVQGGIRRTTGDSKMGGESEVLLRPGETSGARGEEVRPGALLEGRERERGGVLFQTAISSPPPHITRDGFLKHLLAR